MQARIGTLTADRERFMADNQNDLVSLAKIELQRQKVRHAINKFTNDRHAQIAETGLKPSTFYNRLKEVQQTEAA